MLMKTTFWQKHFRINATTAGSRQQTAVKVSSQCNTCIRTKKQICKFKKGEKQTKNKQNQSPKFLILQLTAQIKTISSFLSTKKK